MLHHAISDNSEQAKAKFEEQYITANQIAEHVGVSRTSVHTARTSGRLPNGFDIGSTFIWERYSIQPIIDTWRDKIANHAGAEA